MTFMQSAHGGDESQPLAAVARGATGRAHGFDGVADSHFVVIRLETSDSGWRDPVDGDVSLQQFTRDNAAVSSNGDLVCFGSCGLLIHQDRYRTAARPARC